MKEQEWLTVLDSRGNIIGSADRDVIHHYALWHPTFISIVYDEKDRSVILQAKARSKHKTNGEEFEIDFSAGGHISAGEKPETTLRELEEELGLKPEQYKPVFLGKRQSAANIAFNFSEFEWQYVWLIVVNGLSLNTIKYDRREIGGLIKVSVDDALSLFSGKAGSIDAQIIGLGSAKTSMRSINTKFFVPAYVSGDAIIPRLILAARNYAENGDSDLTW